MYSLLYFGRMEELEQPDLNHSTQGWVHPLLRPVASAEPVRHAITVTRGDEHQVMRCRGVAPFEFSRGYRTALSY